MSIESSSTPLDRAARYKKITDVDVLHKMLVERDLQISLIEEELDILREKLLLVQAELHTTDAVVCIPIDWGLSESESKLLQTILSGAGRVLTKDFIMDTMYPHEKDSAEIKILDVYMSKLRKKLMSRGVGLEINTVWGRGWTIPKESADVWLKAETIRRTASDIESAIQMIADSFGYSIAIETKPPTTEHEVQQNG